MKNYKEILDKLLKGNLTFNEAKNRMKEVEEPEKVERKHLMGRYQPADSAPYYSFHYLGLKICNNIMRTETERERAFESCCETKEEMQAVIDRKIKYLAIIDRIQELNAAEDVIDWENDSQSKYFFQINHHKTREKLEVDWLFITQAQQSERYMATEEIANQILKEFGVEAITETFFY